MKKSFLLSSLVMCTLLCVSILGLYSCSIAPTLSKFPVSDIRLGLNKADVKKQCGFPFRTDVFTRNHKRIDVLYYKEPARVQCERFIITTALTFENDSLVSIIQSDRLISGFDFSVDSIRRR